MLLTTLLNYAIIMSTNKKGGRTNQERTATNQKERYADYSTLGEKVQRYGKILYFTQ